MTLNQSTRSAVTTACGVAVAAVLSTTGATAQSDACQSFSWSIAREQAAFAASTLPTVDSGAQYPAEAVTVALEPQGGVAYPVPPARPPKSDPAYGVVLTAPPIAQAGTYQVTLSDDAWIDLVQNGARLRSTAFSGKTGCTGVRKTVKFSLVVGPLTIEISDSAKDTINLDLLPAE